MDTELVLSLVHAHCSDVALRRTIRKGLSSTLHSRLLSRPLALEASGGYHAVRRAVRVWKRRSLELRRGRADARPIVLSWRRRVVRHDDTPILTR